jgi:uronate dehydrogenase
VIAGDITIFDDCLAITRGIDCVVHLAGIPVEEEWHKILSANIEGCYKVFKASRQNRVKRIIFASSNYVVGFHKSGETIDNQSLLRPDSRYAVSKVFGESLGRLYADKYDLEVACLRLGSFRPKPGDRRMLSTWISPADVVRVVRTTIDAGELHFFTAFAVSNNSDCKWRNDDGLLITFGCVDNADDFAGELLGAADLDPIASQFRGGSFCSMEFEGKLDKIERLCSQSIKPFSPTGGVHHRCRAP